MPLIDVRCSNDHATEVNRPLAMYPATPPCPECGAPTVQYHPPPRTRWSIDPVVVYRDHDGSYRFPGDANGAGAKRYAQQGLERIELRSAADVRRFESQMNKREYSRMCRRVEAAQANRERRESESRSELRRLMPQMTERGRQLAHAAIRRNNDKPRERAKDPGFHVEVFSYDRSNRDESRDGQGRRRRD